MRSGRWSGAGRIRTRRARVTGDAALREVGRRLSEDFLAGPVGAALAARVAEAAGLNEVLELGLEVAGQPLTDLPWEALQVPEASGEIAEAGGSPLVLHRNVAAVPAGRRAGHGPGAQGPGAVAAAGGDRQPGDRRCGAAGL